MSARSSIHYILPSSSYSHRSPISSLPFLNPINSPEQQWMRRVKWTVFCSVCQSIISLFPLSGDIILKRNPTYWGADRPWPARQHTVTEYYLIYFIVISLSRHWKSMLNFITICILKEEVNSSSTLRFPEPNLLTSSTFSRLRMLGSLLIFSSLFVLSHGRERNSGRQQFASEVCPLFDYRIRKKLITVSIGYGIRCRTRTVDSSARDNWRSTLRVSAMRPREMWVFYRLRLR